MSLKPLMDDLAETIKYDGHYKIQLDVPKCSTLTGEDIDKILKMSSWEENPAKSADGFEGIRSVVINRKRPINREGIELGGLQISGIGFKDFDMMSKNPSISESNTFHPPSKENFMERVGKFGWMATSHAEGKKIVDTKPEYRAIGTYTAKELKDKVVKTDEASKFKLEKMVTPYVEAYGRFLDEKLKNYEGNFGFAVLPVPKAGKKRIGNEINDALLKAEVDAGELVAMVESGTSIVPPMSRISKGLRELHDKGRVAHLQTHINNFYMVDGKPYLVDWSTSIKLGENIDENLINRAIDLKKPADNVVSTFMEFFGIPPERKTDLDSVVYTTAMQGYSGQPINLLSVCKSAYNALGGKGTEFDMFVEWMRSKGIERFSPDKLMYRDKKVGRNQPCPCGSGTKYKKCHGKY